MLADIKSSCNWLPARDLSYLADNGIEAECLSDGSQKAIVLKNFLLPANKFKVARADILVLIPQAYPDVPPDMFYADPWLLLKETERYATAADQPQAFAGRNWQRWSRHNNEWRPGRDGIRSHIRRIRTALEEAA